MNHYLAETNDVITTENFSRSSLSVANIDIDVKVQQFSRNLCKGPRSKIVEAILLLLYSKPMRSSEISRILGKPTKLISSYLSYWRSRGYVSYSSGYWVLTKQGEEHVRIFIETLGIPILSIYDVVSLAHKLINEQVQQTVNNWISQEPIQDKTEIQQFIVKNTGTKVGKQHHEKTTPIDIQKALRCIAKILESKELFEDEIQILNYLIKHYVEWGSTYLYLDQLAEELHYQVSELMTVLRKLQSKRLVYLYTDRRFGIRVGIGRSFKQILDQCATKT